MLRLQNPALIALPVQQLKPAIDNPGQVRHTKMLRKPALT
jgi:hypothetical protein